jgi:indolepyruvate ferredoxin oxidoreductase beta subunit
LSADRGSPATFRQQILVSGVGGQGVLFVTRLLADAAIGKGGSVLTSETHGMAQRGGIVVSHLKVGGFPGPLIRPGKADGLIALKEENLALHHRFLAPGGWAVLNAKSPQEKRFPFPVHQVDATGLAWKAGNPQGTNLVVLGFALSRLDAAGEGGRIFCSPDDVRQAVARRLEGKGGLLAASLEALALGMLHGKR